MIPASMTPRVWAVTGTPMATGKTMPGSMPSAPITAANRAIRTMARDSTGYLLRRGCGTVVGGPVETARVERFRDAVGKLENVGDESRQQPGRNAPAGARLPGLLAGTPPRQQDGHEAQKQRHGERHLARIDTKRA